jgi:DNA-binding Lrp family transcriptional regulator
VHEKTFLSKQKSSLITFTEEIENKDLDEISKKILKELYFDSRKNIATIASNLKTTVDIVRNRIKKMEEEKVIIRYTIHINYNKIGYELYKTFIYLKSFDKKEIEMIMNYGKESNKVINIVKQIAPWDIEFIIFATSFKDYNEVVSDFTKKFTKSIKKVETATMSEDIIFPCRKLPFD